MTKQILRWAIGLLVLYAVIITAIIIWKRVSSGPFFINTNHTAVVREIKKLNRLETASFTIEKIIEAGTQGNTFQQWLYGDRVLLIAHGDVIAGVDLSQFKPSDAVVNGQSIKLTLPAPTIFFTRLDNSQTRVYDRRQGLLTKGNKDLEAEARQAAEQTIQQAACQSGILKNAKENAVKQLEALLRGLGFISVTVTLPDGSC